jgi:hypothetical protein
MRPPIMSRDQAVAAVAAATKERDNIQANLLELEDSFGKRMLAGATLAGQTRRRWARADAQLTRLWEIFNEYSAAVDRAAGLVANLRRSAETKLAEVSEILSGPSVRLARAPSTSAVPEITSDGSAGLTLLGAVAQMRRAYIEVTSVCAAAQSVWDEVSDGLQQARAKLDEAASQSAGLADDTLAGPLAAAQATLAGLRETLNNDPLALWIGRRVDTSRLDRLNKQVTAVTARVAEIARLRRDADARIAQVTAAVAAAQAAWQDAVTARERSATKIAAATGGQAGPPLPDVAALAGRLAGLAELRATGRWSRLAAELDAIGKLAGAATHGCRDAEQAAAAGLERRDELRGLLDAYKAKAASLGAAENAELEALHRQARDVLWSAPCDLGAASAAVTSYQQAVLALGRRP